MTKNPTFRTDYEIEYEVNKLKSHDIVSQEELANYITNILAIRSEILRKPLTFNIISIKTIRIDLPNANKPKKNK